MTLINNSESGASVRSKLNDLIISEARELKDVATLLVDTNLTYTAGQDGTVVAGDIVRTRAEGFGYEVAASGATDQHVTTAGGVKLYVLPREGGFSVRAFGAVGDGTTDDTNAIKAAIAVGHSEAAIISGRPGDQYRVTSSIWFGKDEPNDAKMLWKGNGSTFVGDMNNQPVVDMTGIQNGNRWVWDIRVTTAAGAKPSHGIVQARPKQASGVRSSGNANLFGTYVVGSFLGAAYYNVSSESNNLSGCYFENTSGVAKMWSADDYFSGTFELPLTGASGAFSRGETITGGSSGATATVLYTNSTNTALFCRAATGTFTNGETITGGTSGETAATSISAGYTVCSDASPNAALGIETGSTSTFQSAMNVFGNNTRSDDLLPCCIVRSFNDILMSAPNFNKASATGDLMHIHGDVAGMSLVHPYLHATHKNSILIGEEAKTSGTQNVFGLNIITSFAGTPSGARIQTAGVNTRLFDCNLEIFGELNLGLSPMQGANNVVLKSKTATGGTAKLTASGTLEGNFNGDKETVWDITSSASVNRARIIGGTFVSVAAREALTISGGAITVSRKLVLVDTEGAAATDDLDTINIANGMLANGETIFLRALSASRVTTLVTSGNIRGTPVALNSTTTFVQLVYDAASSTWHIL